ncbi:MAG: DNA polymerase III subunit gamma/tau [Chloroflexi bacterium]|nr:DNA polymerase III subunit gamma/tau [Chloroflexota bacterium]
MVSQVFYRKWRPQKLSDIVGQESVTRTLLNALSTDRISHAYLFAGPRGTGKTSTGRILAKAVNCLTNQGKGEPCNDCALCRAISEGRALDVIEIDAASNRGIDDIRDLREKVGYAPGQSRYKVYIIDEVHMLSKDAANALLKTLEEPPPHVIFVLATTEAHKMLPTILSRCQRFDFRRITQSDIAAKLAQISQAEGIQAEPEALRLMARSATGSLRDAENLLQQMATFYGSKIELKQVQSVLGITGDFRAREMIAHIIRGDIPAGIALINNVNRDGLDLRQFNREVVEYLRSLLLIKTGSGQSVDLTVEDKAELQALAGTASLPQIVKAARLFGQLDLSLGNYATLPLELALIDSVLPEPAAKTGAAAPPEPRPAASKARALPRVEKTAPVRAAPPVPTAAPNPVPRPAPLPPAPAQPEPPPDTPGPEPATEIGRLQRHWRQSIKEAVEMSRTPAAALLRSARPKAIEGDTVILSFRYPLLKESLEKADNLKAAEKIMGRILGRACRVQCVHEPEDNHLVEAALKIGAQIIDDTEAK